MSIFTLTDVKIKPKKSTTSKKELVDSQYSQELKRFPSVLGSDPQYLHYMVFYINEQEKTQFKTELATNATQVAINRQSIDSLRGAGTSTAGLGNLREAFSETAIGNAITSVSDSVTNFASKVGNSSVGQLAGNFLSHIPGASIISGGMSAVKTIAEEGSKGIQFAEQNFFRSTKRTTSAIALYMPDTLQFNYGHNFNDISVGEAFGQTATQVAQAMNSGLEEYNKTGTVSDKIRNLSPFLAEVATAFTGNVPNPQLELLFQSTSRRTFSFDFSLTPRSQKEAQDIMEIVRLFKFHAAPEILANVSGRFLVPPSEFDIQFFYNGKNNPNIPKISTCVLTNISANYSPDGWAAFEISDDQEPKIGGTGMPVSIRLSLQFTETQIITKEYLASDIGGINVSGSGSY
jgi:hypothetical protein